MEVPKRRVIQFLEKEIKTYTALALFLSSDDGRENGRLAAHGHLPGPAYYKERMKEARKLVNDLRKQN
jgi:hypothetical protein